MPPDGSEAPASAQASPPSQAQSRYIHSDIYEKLVRNDHDLIGLIAYGLYQKRKRQWLSDFENKRGRTATEQEVKDYCSAYLDDVLSDLRKQADTLLFAVSDGMVDERIDDMQDEIFSAKVTQSFEQLSAKIDKISGYKHHVIGHIAGFVVLVLIAFFITFLLRFEPNVAHWFGYD